MCSEKLVDYFPFTYKLLFVWVSYLFTRTEVFPQLWRTGLSATTLTRTYPMLPWAQHSTNITSPNIQCACGVYISFLYSTVIVEFSCHRAGRVCLGPACVAYHVEQDFRSFFLPCSASQ